MNLKVIKVGNSKGLTLPKAVLEEYQIKDIVELTLKDDHIEIRPIQAPRQNWSDAFQKMRKNGDDELLIPDVFNDEEL